jgi:hypothetical protein
MTDQLVSPHPSVLMDSLTVKHPVHVGLVLELNEWHNQIKFLVRDRTRWWGGWNLTLFLAAYYEAFILFDLGVQNYPTLVPHSELTFGATRPQMATA